MVDENCKDGIDGLRSADARDRERSSDQFPDLPTTNGGSFYGSEFPRDALEFFKRYLAENPGASLEEAIRAWYASRAGNAGIDPNASIGELKDQFPPAPDIPGLAPADGENTRKQGKTDRLAVVAAALFAVIGLLASARGGCCEAKPQRCKRANCETEGEEWDEDTDGNPSDDNSQKNEDAPTE